MQTDMNPIQTNPSPQKVTGRFAPSPTGRMHLGNIFTAVISWLSVRKAGGKWILRIEDLDPQRSRQEYARQIEDDLSWLGLTWDEGGVDNLGPNGPYSQSQRGEIYARYLEMLKETGLTYPCYCTRADIMSTQAPHQTDGRIIYQGTCRPAGFPTGKRTTDPTDRHATRLYVPDEEISFNDRVFGPQSYNLTRECGDFVLQRADGAWAYQLAVVVDDALMGVTEIVRGSDLLLSAAQQLYLYRLLGFTPPAYAHLPLICNERMQRLSKRDLSMSMEELRRNHTPQQLLGIIAHLANLTPTPTPLTLDELTTIFTWSAIPTQQSIIAGL
ncbi:tRNA glutamyl-Q(34) synthetase GluQRS [uncultured Duncaniella sp.]|uniref:tRNA glutamyl-Q(34) synthetase GluQRS n=2 Tax=uncultured Duncaniella sp. TaxID=2768039 RepID=UPI00261BC313|nr:tRNA glutamyl-Q(34) synthetase GluQRS [uncultured Duncaniella sp.]